MDQQQIEKLRAAGYTDDDIRDFVANQPKLDNAPTQTQEETLPEIDVTKPSDTIKNAEAAGIPTGARESSFLSDVATAAPVVLGENAGKLAVGAGALGGLGAVNMYKKGKAMELEAEKLRQAGIQQRFDAKLAAQQAPRMPTAPVAPAPMGPQLLDAAGRPMAPTSPVVPQGPTSMGPVAPQGTPAPTASMAARPPSMLDKTTSMIRQLAANKVVQGLARGANVLGGAQMAAYSPELGPQTPQVGRMRGMEINPLTNRPWTPEQIKQYESNPNMFDAQLSAPQMRR